MVDFAQSIRTYQQEVETLETGAVKNFSKYTSSAGKGASRKMYQPAINKQGEFNKDRIMYLMNTPISAMTEEMKELTDTYATLADKQQKVLTVVFSIEKSTEKVRQGSGMPGS